MSPRVAALQYFPQNLVWQGEISILPSYEYEQGHTTLCLAVTALPAILQSSMDGVPEYVKPIWFC